MNLSARNFADYFHACHNNPPFPWQVRLLETVLTKGWTDETNTISLPTASGKTAILDVAVFALACEVAAGVAQRAMPRRIAIVVDRRIVVDDAFRRACRIRHALAGATSGVLRNVADALMSLGGELPLDAAQLRGGIYREDRWARTPAQPVILCSTVDQVGSRLLHRGYGISASMWPIHAGLLGNDCLIVLDEAHCSEPFRQTLDWVERYRAKATLPLASPFKAVTMTATPRGTTPPFALTQADYDHPKLKQRIRARKLATLHTCGKKDAGFADKVVELVGSPTKPDTSLAKLGTTTLVVVNRVAKARQIRDALGKLKDLDAVLLMGRCRSLQRDSLLKKWKNRLMAGRKREDAVGARPLVVVATQCVEVGADLDVDALVTECCAFDALRQRFGRLDRLGELDETRAAILIQEDQAAEDSDADPIYGKALSRTWRWLQEEKGDAATIDLGIAALDGLAGKPGRLPRDPKQRAEVLGPLTAPAANAPIMFPAYCDLWAQTGPEPAVSPDPSIFLHGPERGEPEVRIVWRADLDIDKPETWAETVSLCPPVTAESLPLPLWLARKWLANGLDTDEGGDMDSAPSVREKSTRDGRTGRFRAALRWSGPDNSQLALTPEDIRPGDTLVVPTSCGGCDEEGWNPKTGSTTDIADEARIAARRCAVLRLHPALVVPESMKPWVEFRGTEWPEDPDELIGKLRATLEDVRKDERIGVFCHLLLEVGEGMDVQPHPGGVGLVLSCDLRPDGDGLPNFTGEDDTAAHAARNVRLRDHLSDVEKKVRGLVNTAGLPADVAADVALAARLHDVGKADPRFQALLTRGRVCRSELLAKSGRMPTDQVALAERRRRAGYPPGARHELLSVRLVESAPELLAKMHDRDLVLHLIESHHGHCRPFAPVVFDDDPPTVTVPAEVAGATMSFAEATGLERLDSGVADRFWSLVRKYGWWGLSYLEACLRLADHRASEQEENA
jgi:CRISPR-associated endonuclease/helicase Cas3